MSTLLLQKEETKELSLTINNTKLKPPVFLTGCGRSGTSLLQKVISKHKNIYSFVSETHFFGNYRYIPSLKKVNIKDLLNKAKYTNVMEIFYKEFEANENFKKLALSMLSVMLHTIEESPDAVQSNCFQSDVLEIFNEIKELDEYKNISNKYDAFNLCANYLTAKSNKKRWADKSGVNIFNSDHILKLYPDAKFIEIYRDPRGVFYSWTRCPFQFFRLTNQKTCIERWKVTIIQGEKLKKELGDRYYRVKYEDLVSNTTRELEKICDFLEEEFDPNMLNVITTNSSFKEFNHKEGIGNERVDHWKSKLSTSEIIFVDLLTKNQRRNIGYPDSDQKLTIANFIPFLLFVTKVCIKAKINPITYIKKIIKENAKT